jgi:hypothetical protein
VPQAVRELYFGYLGWFQADPVGLSPLPPADAAARTIEMMGGHDRVLDATRQAIGKRDYQWGAELATLLIRIDHEDMAAREAKADAFVALSEPEINPNWRNWYMTAALELRGDLSPQKPPKPITGALTAAGIRSALPAATWVNEWTMRLKAEKTAKEKIETTMGFFFPGGAQGGDQGFGDQGYLLDLRRSIAELIEVGSCPPDKNQGDAACRAWWKKADTILSIDKAALDQLITAEADDSFDATLERLVHEGKVRVVKGTAAQAGTFFKEYFDGPLEAMQPLTVR